MYKNNAHFLKLKNNFLTILLKLNEIIILTVSTRGCSAWRAWGQNLVHLGAEIKFFTGKQQANDIPKNRILSIWGLR